MMKLNAARVLTTAALTGAAAFGAVLPASAAAKPHTTYEVCDYTVTASGLWIHNAPNSNASSRIGETFDGYVFVHISDEPGETNGFIYGASNGDTGWASPQCHVG